METKSSSQRLSVADTVATIAAASLLVLLRPAKRRACHRTTSLYTQGGSVFPRLAAPCLHGRMSRSFKGRCGEAAVREA